MGLGLVKVTEILKEREKGEFKDFEDFVVRTKNIISASLLENIIYSGALDCFKKTKKSMIENYQSILNNNILFRLHRTYILHKYLYYYHHIF